MLALCYHQAIQVTSVGMEAGYLGSFYTTVTDTSGPGWMIIICTKGQGTDQESELVYNPPGLIHGASQQVFARLFLA